jgi:hypothetical protein
VINKETSVRTTIGEDIVDRDFELLVPSGESESSSESCMPKSLCMLTSYMETFAVSQREMLGPMFVPMLRIGIIQLELVMMWLFDYKIGVCRPFQDFEMVVCGNALSLLMCGTWGMCFTLHQAKAVLASAKAVEQARILRRENFRQKACLVEVSTMQSQRYRTARLIFCLAGVRAPAGAA